jgi:hypothetical protein
MQVLAKLRARPHKGPVKLSYAEADWLIDLIENPAMTVFARRVLMDQATRKRLNAPGMGITVDDRRGVRPLPPVIDVPVDPPPRAPRARSGWRGNPICDSHA